MSLLSNPGLTAIHTATPAADAVAAGGFSGLELAQPPPFAEGDHLAVVRGDDGGWKVAAFQGRRSLFLAK